MTRVGAFVQTVFDAWDRDGIAYAVLRNHERLPDHIGNDLDVLVAERDRSERILLECARSLGWRLHNRAEFSPVTLFLSASDRASQVHVDLFDVLAWRGFEMFPAQAFLRARVRRERFWVLSPVHEAALSLSTHLLYHGRVKMAYAANVNRIFASEPEAAIDVLADAFGLEHAERLVRSAIEGRWSEIEAAATALRRALLGRCLVDAPLRTARGLAGDLVRLARRWLRPPGLVVVLLGPDGSGKSTAAALLARLLRPSFARSRLLHWKPRVLPVSRTGEADASNPHGRPPRGRLASCAFFAFHLAEFVLGAALLRRSLFRNALVVFDRHYDDFFVDRRRYRLDVPDWLLRAGRAWVRRPDVVIVLDASPELLRSRKQEIAETECARQRDAYRMLAARLPNAHLLDASKDAAAIADEIAAIVLDHLVVRTASRLGSTAG
jgi:thymidylate kinase